MAESKKPRTRKTTPTSEQSKTSRAAPKRVGTSRKLDMASAPQTASKRAQQPSHEQLRHMIAEAAYYRAEQRGFVGGNPDEDWLVAEREITARLGAGARL